MPDRTDTRRCSLQAQPFRDLYLLKIQSFASPPGICVSLQAAQASELLHSETLYWFGGGPYYHYSQL